VAGNQHWLPCFNRIQLYHSSTALLTEAILIAPGALSISPRALAEYVVVYHFTEVLKQPFRIVIRKEGKEIFLYEPMQSDLVRGRAAQMKRFYKEEG